MQFTFSWSAYTLCVWNVLCSLCPHIVSMEQLIHPQTSCSALANSYKSSTITTIQSWLEGLFYLTVELSVTVKDMNGQLSYISITIPTVVMAVQFPVSVIWVDTERDCTCPANTDSTSTTAVGQFLNGVVAEEVLLVVGIVCGACRLEQRQVSAYSHRSFIHMYIDILLSETFKHVPAVLFAMKCAYRCRVSNMDSVIIINWWNECTRSMLWYCVLSVMDALSVNSGSIIPHLLKIIYIWQTGHSVWAGALSICAKTNH